MSIICDHCKLDGTPEDPIFYIEAFLKGVPMLDAIRDLSVLQQPQMIPPDPLITPCTIQLHASCAGGLQAIISQDIQDFILPEEKPSGDKKQTKKRKRSVRTDKT